MYFVGIDISKFKHDCAVIDELGDTVTPSWSFANDHEGFSLRGNSTFEACGYPLRHVLYLVGVQGSGKTTAVHGFSLLMLDPVINAPAPAARAFGSKAAVRDFVAAYRDIPVLLDDVCTSSGSATKRIATEVAAYTLRLAADRIQETHKLPGGGQCSIRCSAGVIITGEFPMQAASDFTRCVIVEVDHQMRGKEEDDRMVACAAIKRFMVYVSENYCVVCETIAGALRNFRADALEACAPRQQQHLAELSCSFQLFLEFAYAVEAIDAETLKGWNQQLQHVLERTLATNMRLVRAFEQRSLSNVASIILEATDGGI